MANDAPLCIFIKLAGTVSELLLPYILEHIIDRVAPLGDLRLTILWGLLMFAAALVCRQLNVAANRRAIKNAHWVSYDVRQELFRKTVNLFGSQFDSFGLPSLISRMTSDSYNVQSAVQQLQSLCVRAPMLLIGGVIVSLVMDASLAMILVAMLPVLILVVFVVTAKGLPMYNRVQQKLDVVVRVMRENITGIRVVKALSKTEYEKRRFAQANQDMTDSDIAAGTVMAVPSPFMQLCLNGGLALVVFIGAVRVNAGAEREKALTDISFALKRGESLGIIGPTGYGKSTIVSLLMRFYDVRDGGVFVDGKDVRTYDKDALRRRFGVCFQNDMVFQDTLRENVRFGRDIDDAAFRAAIGDAMAAEYIDALDKGPDHQAEIRGVNLSGGQRQRLLVARALAADPEILVLDDSSSALDYRTDAAMRKAIRQNHTGSTLIVIAQRVSSIMGMTHILVMDNGRCVGYGTHEELLETCPAYRETYQIQMGEMA